MDKKNNEGNKEEVEDEKSIVNLDPEQPSISLLSGKLGPPQQYH